MTVRLTLPALAGVLAVLAGCGGSGPAAGPTSATAGSSGTQGALRSCPPHRGLRLAVRGLTCAQAAATADAMGPSSARARFTVRGFDCRRPPTGTVRCTRGAAVLALSGGD